MSTTYHEALYVGLKSGEVTCVNCAGYTLRSAIQNAKAKQERFTGMNGELFLLTSAQEMAMGCEYC